MLLEFLWNKEKLTLLRVGLCQLMSTKFNNSLVCAIIIANLYCDLVKLHHLCLCWLARVSHLFGVMNNNMLLMHWSAVCAAPLLWRFLIARYNRVLCVTPATIVLALCWSNFMTVPGTQWSTSANVYLRLKGIIQPPTESLWQFVCHLSVGGTFWLVSIFLC